MSLGLLVGVGLVGGVGAMARFLLDGAVSLRLGGEFPFGTFAVNIVGALVVGVVAGLAVSSDATRLIGVGAVGAFTTFSTWMLETHRLAEDGQTRVGVLNVVGSLAVGIAALWLGRKVGMAL